MYKFRNAAQTAIVLSGMLLLVGRLPAQDPEPCKQAQMLVRTAERFHYQARELDASFGQAVCTQLVTLLDSKGALFTHQQVKQLEAAARQLAEEIPAGECHFLDLTTRFYGQQLEVRDSLILLFRDQVWRAERTDSVAFPDQPEFVELSKLPARWEQWVHLYMLASHLSKSDSLTTSLAPTPSEIEVLKQEILDGEACKLSLMANYPGGLQAYVGSRYLEAIANTFDPHTSYFSNSEKADFEAALSQESLSYGLELSRNEKGEIEVEEIVPGGPAWKSNNLNEGDIIESIHVPGKAEKRFDCLSLREAVSDLSSPNVREATFTVRKQNGKVIEIRLIKGSIQVEDNVIEHFILEGEHKIGYIYLPSFYTDFEEVGPAAEGASKEVATALIKLKREGIEALIFDVRDNGGGSMYEAMRMAGMFIDYGAVAMATMRDEDAEILKDQSRGVLFRAPMIVLQNRLSASASELFSATMQDYHRAVIIGDTSYGKATIQQILPLEAHRYGRYSNPANSPGYIKLTTGAFFRVTGDSHQQQGVQPDIAIPQDPAYRSIGEKTETHALANIELDKESYYRPMAELPISTLNRLFSSRMGGNFYFQSLNSKTSATRQSQDMVPLSFEGLRGYIQSFDEPEQAPGFLREAPFEVQNPAYLQGISGSSESEKQFNESIMQEVKADPYIQEAYFVAEDLLILTQK